MNIPSGLDLESFVQAAADAIIVADAEGKIILWSRAAERLFGFGESEVLGRSLDLIIPERLRERHWAGYEKVMRTAETRYGRDVLRVPAAHKDGGTLSIAFTVAVLRLKEGKRAIAAIMRDETARWKEERELRKRLAELEATKD